MGSCEQKHPSHCIVIQTESNRTTVWEELRRPEKYKTSLSLETGAQRSITVIRIRVVKFQIVHWGNGDIHESGCQ